MTKEFLRFDSRSLRLSLTYLGLIMIMSVGFSLVFYNTSLRHITAELNSAQSAVPDAKLQGQAPITDSLSTDSPTVINKKIQRARYELRRDLILLNLAALVLGGLVSYYLARRTLLPIEAAIEMQTRFASNASHELRTPLAIMQAEIEVALRNPHLSLARAKAALQSNYQEIDQLKELSEGLLRLTRHTQPLINRTDIQVKDLLTEAIARVQKTAQAKDIAIHSNAPALTVSGDAPSLVQALTILLDNAVKYSPKGSSVSITARPDTHAVCLEVGDEGSGIAAKDIPRIFDRFYRGDEPGVREVDGYGLGLAIAHAIVDQHRGIISVQSTIGRGSTFTIKLPREDSAKLTRG